MSFWSPPLAPARGHSFSRYIILFYIFYARQMQTYAPRAYFPFHFTPPPSFFSSALLVCILHWVSSRVYFTVFLLANRPFFSISKRFSRCSTFSLSLSLCLVVPYLLVRVFQPPYPALLRQLIFFPPFFGSDEENRSRLGRHFFFLLKSFYSK